MEKVTIKLIENKKDTISVRIFYRISTAHGMLSLMEALNQEQETEGVYDELQETCREYLTKYEIGMHPTYEFFRGMRDIIVEQTIMLWRDVDSKLEDKLDSNLILGEILGEFIKHFNIPTWNITIEERYDKVLSKLDILK